MKVNEDIAFQRNTSSTLTYVYIGIAKNVIKKVIKILL